MSSGPFCESNPLLTNISVTHPHRPSQKAKCLIISVHDISLCCRARPRYTYLSAFVTGEQNYYSRTHTRIATHIRISLPPEEVRLLVKECINLSFVETEHAIVLIWTYLPQCWQSELITDVPTACTIINSFSSFFNDHVKHPQRISRGRERRAGNCGEHYGPSCICFICCTAETSLVTHTKNNKLAKYNTMCSRCPTSGK